MADVLKSRL